MKAPSGLSHVLVVPALLAAAAAHAAGAGPVGSRPQEAFTTWLRVDNDELSGRDYGYSSGIAFGAVSRTVGGFQDARLTPLTRWINRRLSWLEPRGFDEGNVAFTLRHAIYTPRDRSRVVPDPDDRPYAALLLAGVAWNGRSGKTAQTTGLEAGVVGPSAGGEAMQRLAHRVADANEFRGWDHQLRDEPVVRLYHLRYRKWTHDGDDWQWDFTAHGGGSVGNLATFANAGGELRIGSDLPDNFGSAPVLPAAENTVPVRRGFPHAGWNAHLFMAFDVRYVLRDVTLDGNTWKESAAVERRDVVADLGIGVALRWRGFKIALASYLRTREFEGQESLSHLGGLTVRHGW